MNADPKGMARVLAHAAAVIRATAGAFSEVGRFERFHAALDEIRLVASTLENVIEPSAEPYDRCTCGEAIYADHFTVERDGEEFPAVRYVNARGEIHSCVPSAEPDDAAMLAWAMENMIASERTPNQCGVKWLDGNIDEHWNYAKSWPDAIRLAMTECAALEQEVLSDG